MLSPKEFIDDAIEKIKAQIGDEKAIIALSGGVDSSVCSVLVQKAIGDNLTAVFVDHGLLREGEVEQVTNTFKDRLNFKFVDASDEFMDQLAGVEDPEEKRKIIGRVFIEVFEREAIKSGAKFLVQGTIAPDGLKPKAKSNPTTTLLCQAVWNWNYANLFVTSTRTKSEKSVTNWTCLPQQSTDNLSQDRVLEYVS